MGIIFITLPRIGQEFFLLAEANFLLIQERNYVAYSLRTTHHYQDRSYHEGKACDIAM